MRHDWRHVYARTCDRLTVRFATVQRLVRSGSLRHWSRQPHLPRRLGPFGAAKRSAAGHAGHDVEVRPLFLEAPPAFWYKQRGTIDTPGHDGRGAAGLVWREPRMCRTPILVRESAFFLGERPRKNRFLRYDGNLIAKTLRSRGGRASVATAALVWATRGIPKTPSRRVRPERKTKP